MTNEMRDTLNTKQGHSGVSFKKKPCLLLTGLMMIISPLSIQQAYAVDGQWLNVPGSTDWNTGANWSSNPSVPTGTATFDATTLPNLTFSADTSINQLLFTLAAPSYTIDILGFTFNINGVGVINNSPNPQTVNIATGALTFNNGATSSNAAIFNVDTVNFNNTSNAGTSTISNTGTINFRGAASAANATITSTGLVDISGTTAGTSIGAFTSPGNVNLGNRTLTVGGLNAFDTILGVISGNGGSFIKIGTNTLDLLGLNTFTGTTTVQSGTLQLVGGSLNGPINVKAAGTFNVVGSTLTSHNSVQNSGITNFQANAAANNARITNNAGGLVDISATPGMAIGSLSGAGNVNLGGQTLTLGGLNISNSISGVISGVGGSLTKIGNQTLTLSGTNTYTGATLVNHGTLFNTGSLTSQVTVNAGTAYGGNGHSLSLSNSGTVFPSSSGNGIGTLSVNGNYTQSSTGTLVTKLSSQGTNDRLSITGGTASLGGTLNIVPVGSISGFSNKSYTILTATGGVAGTFSTVINPLLFITSVKYLPNSVIVTSQQSIASSVQTGNPGIIARYLDQITNAGTASPDLDTVLLALQGVAASGNAALANALEQISPDPYRELGFLAFEQTNLLRETAGSQLQRILDTLALRQIGTHTASKGLVSKFQQLQYDIRMGSPFQQQSGITQRMAKSQFGAQSLTAGNLPLNKMVQCGKTNLWIQSFGGLQDKKNSNRLAGTKSGAFGTTLGADLQVFPNTYVGIMGGGMGTDFDWKQSRGKGHIRSYYGGLYGLWLSKEDIYVDGQVTLGGDNYRTHRNINFGTINRKASEKHKGLSVSADLEVGYLWTIEEAVIQPFFNYAYMASHEKGFRESGAGSLNIHRNGKTSQFGRSELGSLFSYFFAYGETLIYPSVKLSWVQKRPLNDGKDVKFNFTDQTLTATVHGDNRVRNLMYSGLSLTAQFKDGIYVVGNVNGEFGSGEKAGSVMASVGYQF